LLLKGVIIVIKKESGEFPYSNGTSTTFGEMKAVNFRRSNL
jgi:hypothetical protein